MKALSILATLFLFTNAMPAFAETKNYQLGRWDTENMKISDIRFSPEFLILSIPTEDLKGAKFELTVQCGNNPNFYYKQLELQSRVETIATDKELVTKLCTQAFDIRDVYIRQLLTTETCQRINWQYGITSIPVALYGKLARIKDRDHNGFACDL
ncbi:MAG: hypothetical protein DSM106950_15110 [Stigonema ocellatum SAG 48.90 = DSM 106950]|nr:hypothetical protein [Stigonema ocellatum SAG 48.90 = DSM 106950]